MPKYRNILGGLVVGIALCVVVQVAYAAVVASAYTAQYDRAADALFLKKVQQAVITAAIQVRAEGTGVADWHSRSRLAVSVLLAPTAYAALFAQGVVSNVSIVDGSTDADIQFTVNSLWSAYAGAGL